jgi:hypothetical protein
VETHFQAKTSVPEFLRNVLLLALILALDLATGCRPSGGVAPGPSGPIGGSTSPGGGSNPGSDNAGNFAGQWRGMMGNITVTFTFQSSGQYTLLVQSPTVTQQQSGSYRLTPPNFIAFTLTDWQPRTQSVYHETGPSSGYYSQIPVPRPADTNNTYLFNGPNTLTLTDQATQGSVTLTRTP